MGLAILSLGWAGVAQAALIAFAIGLALSLAAHALAPRFGWREGTAIGVSIGLALLIGAGVDAWHLFYLSIVRLESPMLIRHVLASIHDPGMLGSRVLAEAVGAVAGVMLGWYLALHRRRR